MNIEYKDKNNSLRRMMQNLEDDNRALKEKLRNYIGKMAEEE